MYCTPFFLSALTFCGRSASDRYIAQLEHRLHPLLGQIDGHDSPISRPEHARQPLDHVGTLRNVPVNYFAVDESAAGWNIERPASLGDAIDAEPGAVSRRGGEVNVHSVTLGNTLDEDQLAALLQDEEAEERPLHRVSMSHQGESNRIREDDKPSNDTMLGRVLPMRQGALFWNDDVEEESEILPLDGTIDLITVQPHQLTEQGIAHTHSWHRQQVLNQREWMQQQSLRQIKRGEVVEEVFIAM